MKGKFTMDFNEFLIELAAAYIEQYGLDNFIAILAEGIPCRLCPLQNKCDPSNCEGTLHKELKVG